VEEGTLAAARALLRFNLEAIPRDSQVLSSRLELYMNREYYSRSPLQIDAHALSRGFTEEATWKTSNGSEAWTTPGGDFESTLAGRQQVSPSKFNEWVYFGLSPLVEHWIQSPASNHGVLLKAANESVAGEDNFQPSCGKPCFQPALAVLYSPRIGNQGEDMVTGAELTNGAEATVNVSNGSLLIENPDIEYQGAGYETALERFYNSQGEGYPDSAFGNGWTLSAGYTTSLESAEWDRSVYLQQPGGAYRRFDPTPPATEATPYSEASYSASEDAEAGLTMQEKDAGTLTYSYSKARWLFNKGLPTKIEEPEGAGNTITLSYAEAPPHESVLSKLEDSHGDTLTIKRISATGEVSAIEGNDSRTWRYGYNEAGELSSYESPEGHKTTYAYGANKLLHVVEDPSGAYVVSYDTSTPARVTSVRKIVNGTINEVGSEDQIVSFEYIAPQSPTCNSDEDIGETIVHHKPEGEEPAIYCYNAAGKITNSTGREAEAPGVEAGEEEAETGSRQKGGISRKSSGDCERSLAETKHCYALVRSAEVSEANRETEGMRGSFLEIEPKCMTLRGHEKQFIDQEQWVIFGEGQDYEEGVNEGAEEDWIEGGVTVERKSGHASAKPYLFIAENLTIENPVHENSYRQWLGVNPKSVGVGYSYKDKIWQEGGTKWKAKVGILSHPLRPHPAHALGLEAGAEITANELATTASLYDLRHQTSNGLWVTGWHVDENGVTKFETEGTHVYIHHQAHNGLRVNDEFKKAQCP
ncbi:MAG: DNRLRE domain-containing protein, partial [Acidimicrobiales bacterium]